MKQSRARKNWVTNTMKMIRDNEPNIKREAIVSTPPKLDGKDLSTVIHAIIRRLNYLYDTARDEDRREAILDKKARLIIQLLLLEKNEI